MKILSTHKLSEKEKKIIFEPSLDERLKDGYYFADANCHNCNDPGSFGISMSIDVMIPTGVKKPTKKFICPNCKVKALKIF